MREETNLKRVIIISFSKNNMLWQNLISTPEWKIESDLAEWDEFELTSIEGGDVYYTETQRRFCESLNFKSIKKLFSNNFL